MNTQDTLGYVRNLVSQRLEVLSGLGYVAEGKGSFTYRIMARPLGGVMYRRIDVEVILYDPVRLTNTYTETGVCLGGVQERKIQYGLGSWCSPIFDPEHAKVHVFVSKRSWNREQNRGTY